VAELRVTRTTNSSIGLAWKNPVFWSGDKVIVRRAVGLAAPALPSSGQEVAASAVASGVNDTRLTPMTGYSYAVFVVASSGAVLGRSTATASTGGSTSSLSEGDVLYGGQSLSSPSGQYVLAMQTDGNLVERYRGSNRVLWNSATDGHPGWRRRSTALSRRCMCSSARGVQPTWQRL
jgi:hypothetical protein